MQSRSLWPFLTAPETPTTFREDIYAEYLNANPASKDRQHFLTTCRTATHKIVVRHGHHEGELYDLTTDPGERFNRWDNPDHATAKTDMLLRLAHRMARAGTDPLPERVGIF